MLKKVLDKISGKYSTQNVFDDFLQMAICAFSNQRMEEEYLQIAKRYDSNELKVFGEALGAMLADYESASDSSGSWDDILGKYFEETNSASQASRSGQFFTPPHICDLMSQIIGVEKVEGKEITVNDPTCGSGRNLISHSRLNANNRFNTFYVGQDLDYRCVKMCALNFLMFGMKGIVIHMNALSLEIYRGYRVWMPETMMMITPLSKSECEQYVFVKNEKLTIIEEPSKIKMGSQISLF